MNRFSLFVLITCLLAAALLALSFLSFAREVEALRPPQPVPEADAIVALTGGSLDRLRVGVELLEAGRGKRLLISGVNPAATDRDISALLKLAPERLQCCVDLGRSATDTIGNGAETAAWARKHEFRRILLVTEDYHMQRSLIELRLAMPEATFVPYPVASGLSEPSEWQDNPAQAGRLATEYGKLLAARMRELMTPQPESAS